jgi:drug/metabolite transporter (DMT)-like permease
VRLARLSFPALVLGNICLAFGPWLVRLADVGPVAAGFWRLAIAAPLLLLLAVQAGQPVWRIPRGIWAMLGVGGLFFAADLAAWHAGILHTRLANATMFGNITSFTFAAYGFIVARRWPQRHQGIAIALALFGIALLLGRSFDLSPRNAFGDLLCILAGLFYTGYLVAIDRARGTIGPMPVLAASTLAGLIPLLVLAAFMGERIVPHDWTPLVLLAIGSQVLGQGMIVFAIAHQPPLIVGLTLLVQPVVAATIGWIAYDERLSWIDLTGMATIAVALVLVRRPGPAPMHPLPPVPEGP